MKKNKVPSEAANQAMELGILLGRTQAFATVAGRCTAAQVDAMRSMRDSKLYLSAAANWGEYCSNVLKMTDRNANLVIGYLNEFGPGYLDLAQLTGITPAAYRSIALGREPDGYRHHDVWRRMGLNTLARAVLYRSGNRVAA